METKIKQFIKPNFRVFLVQEECKNGSEFVVKVEGQHNSWIMKNTQEVKVWKKKEAAEKAFDKFVSELK